MSQQASRVSELLAFCLEEVLGLDYVGQLPA
jgi:hypothetical protein